MVRIEGGFGPEDLAAFKRQWEQISVVNVQPPCRWCGAFHGARCPSVAAMEFHQDGTVKRVEFVQPPPIPVDHSGRIGPTPLVRDERGDWRLPYPHSQEKGQE